MSKVKRLFRYLLPVFVLSALSSLISSMLTPTISIYPMGAVLVLSNLTQSTSALHTALYVTALIGLVGAAMLSECGSLKAARIMHRIFFILFCTTLGLFMLLFLLVPNQFVDDFVFTSASEIQNYSSLALRLFALTVLSVSLAGGLIAQLARKYSMILTLCAVGALEVLALCLGWFFPIAGLSMSLQGVTQGLLFSAGRVLPFLLVPLASYYADFCSAPVCNEADA